MFKSVLVALFCTAFTAVDATLQGTANAHLKSSERKLYSRNVARDTRSLPRVQRVHDLHTSPLLNAPRRMDRAETFVTQ